MSTFAETSIGRFRRVNANAPLVDRWVFECPGCGEWAYLDHDQWHGRVSVDHASMGCPGGYHKTHDYASALEAVHPGATAKVPEGDPVEVRPSDSRAESQAGLKGPSGCPTSPSGPVLDDAEITHSQENES